MLTQEQNDRLTRVGPGTPMGELMRRYWHPVAALAQMKDRHTKRVRLLGEDLVLYKDLSGTYGLVDNNCPHRRMDMIYGVPEECGIRCAYHGWLFRETGECIEQPYETTEDPDSRFHEKVRINAYPVQQMAGLLFAYLGPAPAPLLPRWDVFVMPDLDRDVGYAMLPCNWLQCQENSLDPVHLEWLHLRFCNYILDRLGEPQLKMSHRKHLKIGFDEFEYGIVKRRVVEGATEEDSPWKDGHPVVFPNMLRQGFSGDGSIQASPLGPSFQIRTPIDDTHTAHWWVASYKHEAGTPDQREDDIPIYYVPVPELDADDHPVWTRLDSNSAQDSAAWIGQGPIADRSRENLGRSDKGIILFRKMLEDNLRAVEEGRDPINIFRDPAKNQYLAMKTEHAETGVGYRLLSRQGAATKYSPVLDARNRAKPLEPVPSPSGTGIR
jgi:5,5'-dehydrodivanillate O-demethylase oxygenase subunit